MAARQASGRWPSHPETTRRKNRGAQPAAPALRRTRRRRPPWPPTAAPGASSRCLPLSQGLRMLLQSVTPELVCPERLHAGALAWPGLRRPCEVATRLQRFEVGLRIVQLDVIDQHPAPRAVINDAEALDHAQLPP